MEPKLKRNIIRTDYAILQDPRERIKEKNT